MGPARLLPKTKGKQERESKSGGNLEVHERTRNEGEKDGRKLHRIGEGRREKRARQFKVCLRGDDRGVEVRDRGERIDAWKQGGNENPVALKGVKLR